MMHQALKSVESLLGRRWVNYSLILTGVGLALAVIGNTVYRNWSEFQAFSWRLSPLPLIGASAALVVAFGLNVLTWYLISRTFGSRVGFRKDLEIYSLSTVVRRLPGVIWQLAGRTYLYHQAQTTLAVPLWGTLWEIVVQLSSTASRISRWNVGVAAFDPDRMVCPAPTRRRICDEANRAPDDR
jgi:hypothetical protein